MRLFSILFLGLLPMVFWGQINAELLQSCDDIIADRGELYLKFERPNPNTVELLNDLVYFDHATTDEMAFVVVPYMNYPDFLDLGLNFSLVESYYKDSEIVMKEWEEISSFEAYMAMMNQFAQDFPSICQFHSIGTLSSGREILALKISDNVDQDEAEPKFLYTSTMHGDETAGFPLLLRLSDYLLCNYGENDSVDELVENLEIWINPLANPDGTYRNDNSTVQGATRGNANNLDLNRNFPDPENGPNPDGNVYQEETQIFMDFAETHEFNMSGNFHGGAEVFNYPWDTWENLPADVDWWLCLGRGYADTVHMHSPSGYFNDLNNGVTNGYEWYEVNGGRQDYMTYYFNGREMTLELSNQKLLNTSKLQENWESNYRSLLHFMAEANNGLRGIVTDSETGLPVEAEVFIDGYDKDNSQVYSKLPHGDYYRYLASGTYEVRYSAEDYEDQMISISLSKGETVLQDVQLVPMSVSNSEIEDLGLSIWSNNRSLYLSFDKDFDQADLKLLTTEGKLVKQFALDESSMVKDCSDLVQGIYLVRLEVNGKTLVKKVFI